MQQLSFDCDNLYSHEISTIEKNYSSRLESQYKFSWLQLDGSIAFDLITQTAVICRELVPLSGKVLYCELVALKIVASVTKTPSYM